MPLSEMSGFLCGMDKKIERDEKERFFNSYPRLGSIGVYPGKKVFLRSKKSVPLLPEAKRASPCFPQFSNEEEAREFFDHHDTILAGRNRA